MKLNSKYTPLLWIAILCITFAAIVLRRPDIILNAQPWAEDGVVWMQNIHNNGFFSTIFLPQNGYYQTISKLAFWLGLSFGVEHAALIANVVAILIRCFMVIFLLSNRLRSINICYRISIAIYFILMPNIDEGYVNITNAHWYLSMYLMMILVAESPESKLGRIHDYVVLIIAALSGPFIVFIAPCLFIKRIYERNGFVKAIKGINTFDILAAILTVIQIIAILTTSTDTRSKAPLGASYSLLSDIISYRVFIGTFFDNVATKGLSAYTTLNTIAFTSFALISIYLFIRGGEKVKILFLFPILMIGFSLARPMMANNSDQWPAFLIPGAGQRYFFITNVFFYVFVMYLLSRIGKYGKLTAIALPALLASTYYSYFNIYPLPDVNYKNNIMKYYETPVGESINIQINPGRWQVTLQRK